MLILRSHGGENHANQAYFHVSPVPENIPYNVVGLQRTLPNEEGYFQDRLNYLKPKHVEIVQNVTER